MLKSRREKIKLPNPENLKITRIPIQTKRESTTPMPVGNDLTYKIIGCAMRVHNKMGPEFQEVIYPVCPAIELERAGLSFVREQSQKVYYDDIAVATRRADIVIENQIVVELKALVQLEDVHLAQAKYYTVAYDFPLGLLINFEGKSL
jgi:GxxExxY protein